MGNGESEFVSKEGSYVDENGNHKCGQIVGELSSIFVIGVALVFFNFLPLLLYKIANFDDAFFVDVANEDDCQILSPVDVDQTTHVDGFVRHKLCYTIECTFPKTSFPFKSFASSRSIPHPFNTK